MPPKKGGPKAKLDDDFIARMVSDANKSAEAKEEINPVPERQIVLNNLIVYTDQLAQEDAFRRRKLFVFMVGLLSSILGIILALYATHTTVLFANEALRWDYFGIGCVFFIPCLSWFFWIMCPRVKRCIWCDNFHFMKEYEKRKFLREKRDERRTVAKLTRLYHEGDIEAPKRPEEDPELPYEYDPAQPWLYKRRTPKPPIKVRYDDEGVAWIVTPEEEEESRRVLAEEIAAKERRKIEEDEAYEAAVHAAEVAGKPPPPRKSSVVDKSK